MDKIYNLAIIGCGPAGISAALESAKFGISDVVLLEKAEVNFTTIRKFYKDGKRVDKDYKNQVVDFKGNISFDDGITKDDLLAYFDKIIEDNKIDLRFKNDVDNIKKDGGVFIVRTTDGNELKARFVLIAIGKMGTPNKPSYAIPLEIKNRIMYNANSCSQGEKLLIVGGGNSAVEYAYNLATSNDVILNYRRTEFARINDLNKEILYKNISSGALKTKLGIDIAGLDVSDDKRVRVNFADGSSDIFDKVIYAIGGQAPVDFLKQCGLELDENNIPKLHAANEGSLNGMFIGGDLLYKSGASIAIAFNNSYDIIKEIKNRI